MNEQLQAIKEHWDKTADSAWYQSLRTEEKIAALMEEPARAFHPAVYRMIREFAPDLRGKKALLPSSGDNHAAFALALLGAEAVSADISERQLERARSIADRYGWNIRCVSEETAKLSSLESNCFELIYTSNGTVTWIADLDEMYRNFNRALKPGGISILYDVHPFQRPFSGEPWKAPEIVKPYAETLPQRHWRVQDLMNAMIGAGFSIRRVEELEAVDAAFWFPYGHGSPLRRFRPGSPGGPNPCERRCGHGPRCPGPEPRNAPFSDIGAQELARLKRSTANRTAA